MGALDVSERPCYLPREINRWMEHAIRGGYQEASRLKVICIPRAQYITILP